MDNDAYFQSLTEELNSLKNRVRHFIHHWPSDGEWKESILRTILRRHLPKSIGVGKGFIATPERTSTQIDILFYDTNKPVLYQDGDLLILSPDSVLGAIEVKTTSRDSDLQTIFARLSDIANLVSRGLQNSTFVGFFAYEGEAPDPDVVLEALAAGTHRDGSRIINCVSIGTSFFVRYWEHDPNVTTSCLFRSWCAYDLPNKAPAYFIFNVVEHLCPHSVGQFDNLWFPSPGKERRRIAERSIFGGPPST